MVKRGIPLPPSGTIWPRSLKVTPVISSVIAIVAEVALAEVKRTFAAPNRADSGQGKAVPSSTPMVAGRFHTPATVLQPKSAEIAHS
jgi:hypothetical protein